MKHFVMVALLVAVSGTSGATDPVSFYKDVLPIFRQRCQLCHEGNQAKGNLVLTSYKSLSVGGQSGPVMEPGEPDQSLLIEYVSGERPRMPKVGPPLSAWEVELIREWIGQGAKDDTPAGSQDGRETWWSLRPLSRPAVPEVKSNWVRTPIDAFIFAKLADKGLVPSHETDGRILVRRLSLDLHGLPPTPEEIKDFLADKSPDAYERLVERLLSSPRYGERWARHWLDTVHYGDSHGYDKDKPRLNAWPYRDYVIRAFNTDKPYARFVEEQLAGDVLFPDDPEGVVATGFIAAGPWDFVGHIELREGTVDKKIARLLDRDDMVAATMSTFVSQTVHCARCHYHKFDPIAQEDYYGVQAVFAGVDRAERPYDLDPEAHRRRQLLLRQMRDVQIELQPLLDLSEQITSPEITAADEQIRALTVQLVQTDEAKAELRQKIQSDLEQAKKQREQLVIKAMNPPDRLEMERLQGKMGDLERQVEQLPAPGKVYAAANFFPRSGNFRPPLLPRPIHRLIRGNVQTPAEEMGAGALGCVQTLAPRFTLPDEQDEGSRRAALARWITDPENMLTWRSIVNRVWHYHFGTGLVDTPNDFGRMGSLPSHPELLDWLAVWFRDEAKGSFKALHKLIVTSAVYRQSPAYRAEAARQDPENRALWRMNRMRLDAESVRDSVLHVSGKIDLSMGGPAVQQFYFKDDHSPTYDYSRFDVDSPGSYRRSIYRFIVRSAADPFMDRLDCPDASILTPKRNTTLTAIQALALLNNPFMVRMAQHFAERVRSERSQLPDQIARAFELALGREPADEERDMLVSFAGRNGLENACRLIFNSNEYLFVD